MELAGRRNRVSLPADREGWSADPSPPPDLDFLKIPPFPGAKLRRFEPLGEELGPGRQPAIADCLSMLRESRVGGWYWGAQPDLPRDFLLVRSSHGAGLLGRLEAQFGETLLWPRDDGGVSAANPVPAGSDPWHLLAHAKALVCTPSDPIRLIAAILDVPTYITKLGDDAPALSTASAEALATEILPVSVEFANPFGGKAMTIAEVIALCGFWRSLIDSNRDIAGGAGFAFWKQEAVLPLLWGGADSARFFKPPSAGTRQPLAIWRSKAPAELVERLERQAVPLIEVEDGFLRSNGLGADCVPPLSITVDRLGPYFDPSRPSELEQLLQDGQFEEPLLERARQIRARIVASGLGKYERGLAPIDRIDSRPHILVPGQVEDDRSVLAGGSGLTSNLELLARVRAERPDACILYKPHPDVVAGHRKGAVAQGTCLEFADRIVAEHAISSLLEMVDEVHVNTSLAGFEGLMRGKSVTTYGVPFYAGWGLTRDLGPVPERRSRKRSLDELVAATLLVYPRYLDPGTGLPCPAEVVVERLLAPHTQPQTLLVRARRFQGRVRRRLAQWLAA